MRNCCIKAISHLRSCCCTEYQHSYVVAVDRRAQLETFSTTSLPLMLLYRLNITCTLAWNISIRLLQSLYTAVIPYNLNRTKYKTHSDNKLFFYSSLDLPALRFPTVPEGLSFILACYLSSPDLHPCRSAHFYLHNEPQLFCLDNCF